nr:hypothetical protein [Paenibacillus sp.]
MLWRRFERGDERRADAPASGGRQHAAAAEQLLLAVFLQEGVPDQRGGFVFDDPNVVVEIEAGPHIQHVVKHDVGGAQVFGIASGDEVADGLSVVHRRGTEAELRDLHEWLFSLQGKLLHISTKKP